MASIEPVPARSPWLARRAGDRLVLVRIAAGRVVAGRVVVEGEPLPDGARVLVVIDEPGDDEPYALVPEEDAELLESIREADRGLLVDAWHSLRDLGRKGK